METRVSEAEARDCVYRLHRFLSEIGRGDSDYPTALRALALLNPFLVGSLDKNYAAALCGLLSKGIGDWKWSDAAWSALEPLLDEAGTSVIRHVHFSGN
jgi:hypothetical protein